MAKSFGDAGKLVRAYHLVESTRSLNSERDEIAPRTIKAWTALRERHHRPTVATSDVALKISRQQYQSFSIKDRIPIIGKRIMFKPSLRVTIGAMLLLVALHAFAQNPPAAKPEAPKPEQPADNTASQPNASAGADAKAAEAKATAAKAAAAKEAAAKEAAAKDVASAESRPASKDYPTVEIHCVRVDDHETFGGFGPGQSGNSMSMQNASDNALRTGHATNPPAGCKKGEPSGILVGNGDVVVAISSSSYEKVFDYQAKKNERISLYINGVNLKSDAALISTQRLGSEVFLRYNIRPGEESRKLWAALYRSGSIDERHPLSVGLGWNLGPANDSVPVFQSTNSIAVTDTKAFRVAIGVIAAIVLSGALLGVRTDIFRDSKLPAPFIRAADAQRAIINGSPQATVLTDIDPAYAPGNHDGYTILARQALAGMDIAAMDANKLAVGLVLSNPESLETRSTYSLGRTQLGMWFLFAIAAGSYLWIVFGDLPKIEGSLITLLGLSIGLTGMSMAVDQSNPKISYRPTKGIFRDLVTDWDDQHQVHRFQAVLVNLLLLAVGIFCVIRDLTFPTFDGTWLTFLGISGVALAAGKSLAEGKK